MPRKTIFSYFDWAQDSGASISVGAGSFLANLPATRMLTVQPQRVAQATGTSITFTVNLGASRTIGLIHLQNLVTDPSGTIQVVAGAYDSGTVSSWPSGYSALEYAALGYPRVFMPTSPVSASSATFTINGVASPLQIGFVGVCEIFELSSFDVAVGAPVTIIDGSDVSSVPFGSTYITRRATARRMDCALLLPIDEVSSSTQSEYLQAFRVALINGKSRPVMVVPFPDEAQNVERRQVWGTITTDQQFSNRFFGYYDTTFQITQLT